MADKDLQKTIEDLCSSAESEYSGIAGQMSNLVGKIRECKNQVNALTRSMNEKQAQISSLNASISRSHQNIAYYRQEYYELIQSAGDAESESERRSIQTRANELEAMTRQEQSNIQRMESEISALNGQIAQLQSEINRVKELGRSYVDNLKEQIGKCTALSDALDNAGAAATKIASRIEGEARPAFDAGARTRFGSASAAASTTSSNKSKALRDLSRKASQLSARYRTLADNAIAAATATGGEEREREIPRASRGYDMER